MNLLIGLVLPIISYSSLCSIRLNGDRSRDGFRWGKKRLLNACRGLWGSVSLMRCFGLSLNAFSSPSTFPILALLSLGEARRRGSWCGVQRPRFQDQPEQALLTTSCVTRPSNPPSQSTRFLLCKMETTVGCVLHGWEEVNEITPEKSRARCLAQSGGQISNISCYSYYWHVTHLFLFYH